MELEDKPELAQADIGEFVLVQPVRVRAIQPDFAGGGHIQHAQQIEQRRFPRARRPHDRDEFALLDFERDVLHKRDGNISRQHPRQPLGAQHNAHPAPLKMSTGCTLAPFRAGR